jgi:hypothetical protein
MGKDCWYIFYYRRMETRKVFTAESKNGGFHGLHFFDFLHLFVIDWANRWFDADMSDVTTSLLFSAPLYVHISVRYSVGWCQIWGPTSDVFLQLARYDLQYTPLAVVSRPARLTTATDSANSGCFVERGRCAQHAKIPSDTWWIIAE